MINKFKLIATILVLAGDNFSYYQINSYKTNNYFLSRINPRYWDGGIQPILDKLGKEVGSTFKNCIIDSYEVGCNNWTKGFEKEFERLRGYDCWPYLPTLAGYYVESGEITERFLWDFRRTIGDLISENYYHYFAERCHKVGLQLFGRTLWRPFRMPPGRDSRRHCHERVLVRERNIL